MSKTISMIASKRPHESRDLQSAVSSNESRREWSWRNPPRPWRTAIVACVFALPGFLAGALLGTGAGRFWWLACLGAAFGALVGATLEMQD